MADPQADMSAPTDAPDAGEDAQQDLAQGYCVELHVLPDGTYKVVGPEPLEEEAQEDQGEAAGSEAGKDVSSIGDALKAILGIVKANPVGNSDQASFEAGYQAG